MPDYRLVNARTPLCLHVFEVVALWQRLVCLDIDNKTQVTDTEALQFIVQEVKDVGEGMITEG